MKTSQINCGKQVLIPLASIINRCIKNKLIIIYETTNTLKWHRPIKSNKLSNGKYVHLFEASYRPDAFIKYLLIYRREY